MSRIGTVYLLACLLGPAAQAGTSQVLDDASLMRALQVAQSSNAERRRFHNSYEQAGRSPLESTEIVTPFRKAVMLAEEHSARDGHVPSIQELRRGVQSFGTGVVVVGVVTLDPRHTYIRPPSYSIDLLVGRARLRARAIERRALGPRGLRVPSTALGGTTAMTAVEIEAEFPSNPFGMPGCCRAAVTDPEGDTVVVVDIASELR